MEQLKALGQKAADFLISSLNDNDVVAVTGGTTVAQVPKSIIKLLIYKCSCGARRGADSMKKLKYSQIQLLQNLQKNSVQITAYFFVPDNLSVEAMESMVNEPDIRELINAIHNADILLHGIGRADEMARRRGMNEHKIK